LDDVQFHGTFPHRRQDFLLGMKIPYFDSLIASRLEGFISDHVHLGLFDYAKPYQTLDEAQTAMSQLHLDHLGVSEGDTIVDVGCGFGGTLRLLDETASHFDLTGVNIDPRQIKLAKEGVWQNPVTWQHCDAAQFSDGRRGWADRILSLEALFHFPDPAGFFAAAAAALRPGGRFVVSTILLVGEDNAPDTRSSIQTICQGFGPWPFPDMAEDDLCNLAKAAGLNLLCTQNVSSRCVPGFDWMASVCPPEITDNPVIELRRLFESGRASYVLFVFDKPAENGSDLPPGSSLAVM
jgi:SAM-dependent methyltransferase